jgi:hypothetical protein
MEEAKDTGRTINGAHAPDQQVLVKVRSSPCLVALARARILLS